jgi:hypothetical protein
MMKTLVSSGFLPLHNSRLTARDKKLVLTTLVFVEKPKARQLSHHSRKMDMATISELLPLPPLVQK